MGFRELGIFILIIVLFLIIGFNYNYFSGFPGFSGFSGKTVGLNNENGKDGNSDYGFEYCFVLEVIDGDTFKCSDIYENESINEFDVRLLGVNTPEKAKPYYNEAKNFLKEIENDGVKILRDREDIDKYGRKLRYVFYEERLINAEILQSGFATGFMLSGLKYEDKFKSSEDFARKNEIGLWEKSKEKCSYCIELRELNYEVEFFVLINNCDFKCDLKNWSVKDEANHFFKLGVIDENGILKIESENIWNDYGDRFFMRDNKGKLVIYYSY